MKELKAKLTFTLNGILYEKGDVINTSNINDIIRLNENGFIEPLSAKDLQNIANNLNSKKVELKEEG